MMPHLEHAEINVTDTAVAADDKIGAAIAAGDTMSPAMSVPGGVDVGILVSDSRLTLHQ